MLLDNYVNEIKKYINNNNLLVQEEIVMYVYLDLAKRFSFDENFFFGGSKRKKEIYQHARYVNDLNKCMENNKIICRSAAYILEYVLKNLNINIMTVYEDNSLKKYQHVFNIIKPCDGSEEYVVDLQEDMANIHFHSFTSNFGTSITDEKKYIISKKRQKEIHQKLGYISEKNLYTDEYIDLFKMYTYSDIPFNEKIDLVLKNIDPYPYPDICYWERRWQHEKILSSLFDSRELKNKLNIVEFYRINKEGDKEYNNGFFLHTKDGVVVYYYSCDNYQYESYDIKDFALKVLDENIYYNQGIMGLNHELKILKGKVLIKK